MSTDNDQFRMSQNPVEEEEWSSAEADAAQEETAAEGFPSAGDDADPVGLQPDRDRFASAYTAQPAEDDDETVEPGDALAPEGVAKPEDLGGLNIGAIGEPLVGAKAQEEFLSRWTQIQVSFLEDPPTAVESAAALIQEISAAIRTSLEERGDELAAEGRAAGDTEQLRLALRQYRAFIGVILPR